MRFRSIVILFLAAQSYSSSAKGLEESGFTGVTETPSLHHHDDLQSLHRALKESESYYERLPSDWKIEFRKTSYDKKEMLKSIGQLRRIFQKRNPKQRKKELQESFEFLETADLQNGKITGYYEVIINGRLHPEGEFQYPILETPSDLIVKKETDGRRIGKIVNGNFVSYETRAELSDSSVWKSKTKAIAFVKITDLHLAQLEGSAVVQIRQRNPFRITYASDNGKEYRSPAESLQGICKSLIPSDLKDCIQEYPKEVKDAILQNPRYVFFKRESSAPRGSGGIELIPKRSVAMDPNIPLGIPALLTFDSPLLAESNRIVFVHDRGSKITGHGRLDYFLGTGKRAEEQAGRIQTQGRILLILPKK
ncbi:MltA domain-containing protein [Leptospira yasudae]|uniref:MltA domain-containing protein n=1 Tax=Leptospira yasudae TaxID=2202201 RepID=UPI001090B8E1|nr:MltA domain-containing protein [Leptospira yasudae]TGN01162.1 murein transglycosylase [Leptospira yasudae]